MSQRIHDRELIHELREETGWPDGIYRKKTLAEMFDVSRSTITRLVKEGVLPKPFQIGATGYNVGWKRSEIATLFEQMERVA